MSARGARSPHSKRRGEGNEAYRRRGHHTRARLTDNSTNVSPFLCVRVYYFVLSDSGRPPRKPRPSAPCSRCARSARTAIWRKQQTSRDRQDPPRSPRRFARPIRDTSGRGSLEEARALTEQISAQITWLMDHKDQHMYGRAHPGKGLPMRRPIRPSMQQSPPPIEQQHHFDERDVVRPSNARVARQPI